MKRDRRFSTRYRAIVSSVVIGLSLFFLLSPLVSTTISFILPPNSPKNVEVIEKNREVDVRWDNKNIDNDIVGFRIVVGDKENNVNADVDSYIVSDLDNDTPYEVKLYSLDNTNRTSSPVEFEVNLHSNKTNSFSLNSFNELEFNQRSLFWISVVLALITLVLTQWILFFRLKGKELLTLGLYPAISILPFTLLTSSLYFSINTPFYQTFFVFLASIGFVILSYIIFLTVNILNSSLKQQIPLEQAARAAKFIISLIASYVIFIFALSSNYGLAIKFLIVIPFIFYFTYSGIWILKTSSSKQIMQKTLVITLLMAISLMVILIWPLNIIYSILTASVIYYILLNVALDYRTKLNLNYWIEYIILIALVSFLLLTTAVWGINGTII